MKKLLGLFLSATLILALLVGCSKVEYRMYYLLSAKSSKPPSEISGIPIEEEHALFGDITSGVWHEPDHSVETLLPYTDEDAPKTFNIQIGDVKEAACRQKIFFNKSNQSFDFSLCKWMSGLTQFRTEPNSVHE